MLQSVIHIVAIPIYTHIYLHTGLHTFSNFFTFRIWVIIYKTVSTFFFFLNFRVSFYSALILALSFQTSVLKALLPNV